ncbi:hypothetical protein BKA81DRAFT_10733, partial [Phyllosticta paracitricarpa]
KTSASRLSHFRSQFSTRVALCPTPFHPPIHLSFLPPSPSSSPPPPRPLQTTMCTRFIHTYGCGHQVVEKAPCATSRSAPCGVLKTTHVKHDEKCDSCDG